MIKTKTPRHWGGIRQVSPPMLTSRLSNKRGGRTNGWKDYSRDYQNDRCWKLFYCDTNSRIRTVLYCKYSIAKNYICGGKHNKCIPVFWLGNKSSKRYGVTNRKIHFISEYYLGFRPCKFLCTKCFKSCNIGRLTLKGVA